MKFSTIISDILNKNQAEFNLINVNNATTVSGMGFVYFYEKNHVWRIFDENRKNISDINLWIKIKPKWTLYM